MEIEEAGAWLQVLLHHAPLPLPEEVPPRVGVGQRSEADEGSHEDADRGPRGQLRRGRPAQRLHRCLLGGDQVRVFSLSYINYNG